MNKLMLSLGLATAFFAQSAQAVTQWTVTDAATEFRLFGGPFTLVDEQGVYGQVGRQFQVRNIQGRLDPAFDATLYKTTQTWGDNNEHSYDEYDLTARYRFTYDIYDVQTGSTVVREDRALEYIFHASSLMRHHSNPERTLLAGHRFTALEDLGVFSGINYYPTRSTGYDFALVGEDFPNSSTISYPYSIGYVGYWALDVDPDFIQAPLGLVHRGYTTLQVTPVPEPETYALLLTGALGLGLARRFGRKAAV